MEILVYALSVLSVLLLIGYVFIVCFKLLSAIREIKELSLENRNLKKELKEKDLYIKFLTDKEGE